MANRWGNNVNSGRLFSWAPKLLWMITVATKLKEFAPWKKGYDKPRQCIKKQRHHFANNGLYSQSYAFSIWLTSMYGCESWPIKKAECQRTDAFKLWCWRRFFRVPWTARRSN